MLMCMWIYCIKHNTATCQQLASLDRTKHPYFLNKSESCCCSGWEHRPHCRKLSTRSRSTARLEVLIVECKGEPLKISQKGQRLKPFFRGRSRCAIFRGRSKRQSLTPLMESKIPSRPSGPDTNFVIFVFLTENVPNWPSTGADAAVTVLQYYPSTRSSSHRAIIIIRAIHHHLSWKIFQFRTLHSDTQMLQIIMKSIARILNPRILIDPNGRSMMHFWVMHQSARRTLHISHSPAVFVTVYFVTLVTRKLTRWTVSVVLGAWNVRVVPSDTRNSWVTFTDHACGWDAVRPLSSVLTDGFLGVATRQVETLVAPKLACWRVVEFVAAFDRAIRGDRQFFEAFSSEGYHFCAVFGKWG